jgi:hypothetical protein
MRAGVEQRGCHGGIAGRDRHQSVAQQRVGGIPCMQPWAVTVARVASINPTEDTHYALGNKQRPELDKVQGAAAAQP